MANDFTYVEKLSLISDLEGEDDDAWEFLSEWEQKFIYQTQAVQDTTDKLLSHKEEEKIDEIWEKLWKAGHV